ncbi:MAG: MerR family transcriptional regulator [Candidatus Omnitrophica bacterium]|nr:MerR family transcriptional regulator [Candidatus Omnitrophota bacterium]
MHADSHSDNRPESYFSTSIVTRETGISLRQLYYWETLGIVRPQFQRFGTRMFRRYHQAEVDVIRKTMKYLKEGYHLRGAAKKAKADLQTDLFNDNNGDQ